MRSCAALALLAAASAGANLRRDEQQMLAADGDVSHADDAWWWSKKAPAPLAPQLAQTVEIIFVRHGFSCANIHKRFGGWWDKKVFSFISDPTLTSFGVATSRRLAPALRDAIAKRWPGAKPVRGTPADDSNVAAAGAKPYTVGASVMLRAQETAFWMLADTPEPDAQAADILSNDQQYENILTDNAPISVSVLPHIGEKSKALKSMWHWAIGNDADNRPKAGAQQRSILAERSPAVLKSLEAGSDYRLKIKTSAADKSKPDEEASPKLEWSAVDAGDSASFDAFKNWLLRDGQGMCARGADGVRRCVIVSHTGFLTQSFRLPKKLDNNEAVFVRLQYDPKTKTYATLEASAAAQQEMRAKYGKPAKPGKAAPPAPAILGEIIEYGAAALTEELFSNKTTGKAIVCSIGDGCDKPLCLRRVKEVDALGEPAIAAAAANGKQAKPEYESKADSYTYVQTAPLDELLRRFKAAGSTQSLPFDGARSSLNAVRAFFGMEPVDMNVLSPNLLQAHSQNAVLQQQQRPPSQSQLGAQDKLGLGLGQGEDKDNLLLDKDDLLGQGNGAGKGQIQGRLSNVGSQRSSGGISIV